MTSSWRSRSSAPIPWGICTGAASCDLLMEKDMTEVVRTVTRMTEVLKDYEGLRAQFNNVLDLLLPGGGWAGGQPVGCAPAAPCGRRWEGSSSWPVCRPAWPRGCRWR